jgi:hypothetical protein
MRYFQLENVNFKKVAKVKWEDTGNVFVVLNMSLKGLSNEN